MPRFLSVEWLDALAGAATSTHALREVADRRFAIQQTVRDTPEGDVTYHVVVEEGGVTVRVDDAVDADVTFDTDYATAVAINRGEQSAQAAFLRGQLRVGGDVAELARNADVLALLDDVFADVRARTEY